MVWRSDSCLEIGYPPRSIRLDGIDPIQATWLAGLRGDRTLEAALADGAQRGLRPTTMRRLLNAGVSCGLIDDAGGIPQSLRDASVTVRDMLAGDIASARHIHGAGAHAMSIIDRRRSAEVAVHGEGAVADALVLVLTSAGIGSVARSETTHSSSRRHRRRSADRSCHVICESAHPDAAADPDAMALDIPHLALSAAGARAVIGPLVIPGRTSCLRCRELHLADADPTWPRAAVQWAARRSSPVSAGLAHLAGAWGALHVLALIDSDPQRVQTPVVDGALVIELPHASGTRVPRPPHPLCGCRWPASGAGSGPRGAGQGPAAA
jgi:hypothetical protein